MVVYNKVQQITWGRTLVALEDQGGHLKEDFLLNFKPI